MNDIEQELREIGSNFNRAADEIASLRSALHDAECAYSEVQNDLDYMRERAEKAEEDAKITRVNSQTSVQYLQHELEILRAKFTDYIALNPIQVTIDLGG